MPIIYILKLRNEKYYIGKTTNLENRINQHEAGYGSEWTKLHRPISVIDTMVQNIDFSELAITLQYMKKYGIDNVRGASYSNINLTDNQKTEIKTHIRGEYNLCLLCGNEGHFIKDCPQSRSCLGKIFEKMYNYFYCFRKEKNTDNYTLIDDVIKFGKYRGYTYSEIWEKDRGYCNWVKSTDSSFPEINKFKLWLYKQSEY